MKTDYTLTPEFDMAIDARRRYLLYQGQQNAYGSVQYDALMQQQLSNSSHAITWPAIQTPKEQSRLEDARLSYTAGEPLIRAACKIATRMLLVLLLVGLLVGMML